MTVLDKIVSSKRLPVLFIGSGISKRYLYHYPDWNGILKIAYKKVDPDPFQFQKLKESFTRKGMSNYEVNINMASAIEEQFNAAYYDRHFTIPGDKSKYPAWVSAGVSPFKRFLAQFFKNMQLYHREDLSLELEKFKLLKSRISAVITTNYDLFLEKHVFPKDYSVFIHQEELFGADSYNIAEIYKIHGSAKDPNSIIITKDDYGHFYSSRKLIIAKMLTLFSESPIVFLGYSFTDENIRSIIIDFLDCLSKEQLETISDHFVFISYKAGESDLVEIKRTVVSQKGDIPITEIQTDNFSKVYDTLNQITPGISPARVRETRRVIKQIVDTSISSEAASIIVGLDDLDNLDISSKPLAIAIGYRDSILSKVGYGIINDELIIEDILYDNMHLDAYSMCFDRYKSIPHTRLLPVFKYVRGAKGTIPAESNLGIYIEKHNSIEKIINATAKKYFKNLPECHSMDELMKQMDLYDKVDKKSGILLKSIPFFDTDQIRDVCKSLFEYNRDECRCTNFKRCVMYLDFIENYEEQKENQ